MCGCARLGHTASFNKLLYLDHDLGAQSEVARFGLSEAEIPKYVAATAYHLHSLCHPRKAAPCGSSFDPIARRSFGSMPLVFAARGLTMLYTAPGIPNVNARCIGNRSGRTVEHLHFYPVHGQTIGDPSRKER